MKNYCSFRRRSLVLALLMAMLVLAGCGRYGKLHGKVLYKDKPVPNARIQFLCQGGKVVDAKSDDAGNYSVSKVPLGHATVIVHNMEQGMMEMQGKYMTQAMQGSGKDKSADIQQSMDAMMKQGSGSGGGAAFVPLPQKAAMAEQSGIAVDVTGGSQEFDIVVTD